MNKVYKVIYSKARQCYIVVSELAKNHHKSVSGNGAVVGSNKLSRLLVAALAAGVLTWGSLSNITFAADPASTPDPDGNKISTDSQNVNIKGKDNTVTSSSNQIIIGDKNEISNRDKEQRDDGITDITIGHGNKLSGISHWDGNPWGSLTVIGNNNESGIHSVYGIVSGIVIGDNQNLTGIEQIKESIAIGSLSPEEKAEKDDRGDAKYTVGRDSTINWLSCSQSCWRKCSYR